MAEFQWLLHIGGPLITHYCHDLASQVLFDVIITCRRGVSLLAPRVSHDMIRLLVTARNWISDENLPAVPGRPRQKLRIAVGGHHNLCSRVADGKRAPRS